MTVDAGPGKAGSGRDTGVFSAEFWWESRVKNKNKNLGKSWEILFAALFGVADVLVFTELLWALFETRFYFLYKRTRPPLPEG